ncbi:hypothetical protein RM530_08585 [Algiphilus sp. W345]|uniref:Uncharacterized protein n=1 Tax=Banduia mediterranea TaxID=3075609 RepID=A0ABU2WHR3_9GAMM|nr:hypothetical protein [Algiphilus sp. W345]MDT0497419.1 hypothetical protein [Algiphilus sp. W345]
MTDDSVAKAYEQTPLLAFSWGTCLQLQILRETAAEIRSLIVAGVKPDGPWDGNSLSRAQGHFWLWVLGAYEVLRTMAQASSCFTPELHARITVEKRHFNQIRIPFAKQERAGAKKGDATSTWREVFSLGYKPDGDIIFSVGGTEFCAKDLMERFELFIKSIKRQEVLQSHEQFFQIQGASAAQQHAAADVHASAASPLRQGRG